MSSCGEQAKNIHYISLCVCDLLVGAMRKRTLDAFEYLVLPYHAFQDKTAELPINCEKPYLI